METKDVILVIDEDSVTFPAHLKEAEFLNMLEVGEETDDVGIDGRVQAREENEFEITLWVA